jgi:hypothetical protein
VLQLAMANGCRSYDNRTIGDGFRDVSEFLRSFQNR